MALMVDGEIVDVAEHNQRAAKTEAIKAEVESERYAQSPEQRNNGDVKPLENPQKCADASLVCVAEERDIYTELRTGWRQIKCNAGGGHGHVFWERKYPSQIKHCRVCAAETGRDKRGPALKYNLTDQPFGKLVARTHVGAGQWQCDCACGNSKVVTGQSLRIGMVKSCGSCPRDAKRPGGVTMIQVSAEAKKQLERARQIECRPLIDLASEAIEAVWGNLQE